jgi:hypothetical protein
VRIVAILEVIIGKVDVDFDLVRLRILGRVDLYHVASFFGLTFEVVHLLLQIIGVLAEDVDPHLIDLSLIEPVQNVQLLV